MKNIIKQQDVFSGAELINFGKEGQISESFTSKAGEVFTKINNRLCYISKAAREDFEKCKVSGLQVVEITTKNDETEEESSFLRLQKAGVETPTKQGDWQ